MSLNVHLRVANPNTQTNPADFNKFIHQPQPNFYVPTIT